MTGNIVIAESIFSLTSHMVCLHGHAHTDIRKCSADNDDDDDDHHNNNSKLRRREMAHSSSTNK